MEPSRFDFAKSSPEAYRAMLALEWAVASGAIERPILELERERAALASCEALTLVAEGRVPDHVYGAVRPHFSDRELGDLSLAIVAINGWNRLMVASRRPAGTYEPARLTRPD